MRLCRVTNGIFTLLVALIVCNSGEQDDSRILFGSPQIEVLQSNPEPHEFCDQVRGSLADSVPKVKCTCTKNVDVYFGMLSNLFTQLEATLRFIQAEEITFEFCSFTTIESRIFTRLKLGHLKRLFFSQSNFSRIETRAFSFFAPSVEILIANASLTFPSVIFHQSVSKISIIGCILHKFHSKIFHGMSTKGVIEIIDCTIFGPVGATTNSKSLAVESITFKNVKFEDVVKPILDLNIHDHILFEGCSIRLIYPNLIKIRYAKEVIFDHCILELDSLEPIEATADIIKIINSKLEQPKQKCLMGLVGSSDDALLVLSNITITDPPKGALATSFFNVELVSIQIEDSCLCNIIHHLACDEDNFALNNNRFSPGLSCDETELLLANQTFCKHNSTSPFEPIHKICQEDDGTKTMGIMDDAINQAIVGSMIGGVLLILGIAGSFVYKWHLKASQKRKIIEKWKMAFPATTVYKQPEVVSFDLENVQYISRPTSLYFHPRGPDLVQDLTKDQQHLKMADLINSMAKAAEMRELPEQTNGIHAIAEENEEIEELEEPIYTTKFQFLRKKSKMIRKAFSKTESNVSLNSMVVYDEK